MKKSSSFTKSKISLMNLSWKGFGESSLLTIALNNVNYILNHVWFIWSNWSKVISSLQIITWIDSCRHKLSSGIGWMIISKILIDPNFAVSIIIKSYHSITHSHWSTLFIGPFKSLERSIKNIKRFGVSKLRSIS